MAKTSGTATTRRKTPISDSRIDTVLAAMIVGIIVLSAISMILYMIGTSAGWFIAGNHITPIGQSIWILPFVGLPIAVILMVVVLIRVGVRRSRANRRDS